METTIHIKELAVDCILGVTDQERKKKQTVHIDLLLKTDAQKAVETDTIKDIVSYSDIRKEVILLVSTSQFHLLEALTHAIVKCCLSKKGILSAIVTVTKPTIYPNTKGVSIIMTESI